MSPNRDWTIEGFLDVREGVLHIDGVSALDLASDYGTPLFVFSSKRLRHNIDRVRDVANVIDRPLKICYAAKAMSTMGILRAVREAGIDIEVNSGGELWKALGAGFTGDQIIFNGTSKEVWELEMAIDNGIYAIQVDSLYELSLIEKTAETLGKRATVSLRLVPEIESDTHSGLQTAMLTSKFGMMPEEALAAFAKYRDSPAVDIAGIHLHIGSQNPDPKVYEEALEMLAETLIRVHQVSGSKLTHINLGGGFPVDYVRGTGPDEARPAWGDGTRNAMLAADYAPSQALSSAWAALRRVARSKGASDLIDSITLLLEPGRSIIADAGICLTTVRSTKERPEGAGTAEHWLLTDAGFNILLSMETYKWYYHLVSATRAAERPNFPYKVAGPLCDGGDVYFDIEGQGRLPQYRMLPGDVAPGDVLALLNCGAYSLAQASQYNGRFLPAVVLISPSGKPELIRKRDSFADLIRNDL